MQEALVTLIVGIALVYVARHIWLYLMRARAGGRCGSGCAACKGCAVTAKPQTALAPEWQAVQMQPRRSAPSGAKHRGV
jgi:hypothetical protein